MKLLRMILISPESEISKGNLIQNLAYGRKENIIASMSNCKTCDLIFSIASSVSDQHIFNGSNEELSSVFSEIFAVIATIFGNIDISDFVLSSSNMSFSQNLIQNKIRKPIRHGRFSGSVSIQLSVSLI
jgi:hypothetical protein